ncbi:MAG: hypothetical protein EOM35_06330 [Negativicutes bacterium]|nr:hypothetical protein [Negativicutes bacterium]
MKIVKTKRFPFGTYTAINIFGILFTKLDKVSDTTLNHEKIHTAQMKELLYLGFYLWYIVEYLLLRVKNSQRKAYEKISFEQEAYKNEKNLEYLKSRNSFAWLNYINKTNKQ